MLQKNSPLRKPFSKVLRRLVLGQNKRADVFAIYSFSGEENAEASLEIGSI